MSPFASKIKKSRATITYEIWNLHINSTEPVVAPITAVKLIDKEGNVDLTQATPEDIS
jgi:hypothetical protein